MICWHLQNWLSQNFFWRLGVDVQGQVWTDRWNPVSIILCEFRKHRRKRIPQSDAGFVPGTEFEKSHDISVQHVKRLCVWVTVFPSFTCETFAFDFLRFSVLFQSVIKYKLPRDMIALILNFLSHLWTSVKVRSNSFLLFSINFFSVDRQKREWFISFNATAQGSDS